MTTVTGYAEQRIQSTQQRIMSSNRLMEIVNRFNLYTEYKDRWTTEEVIEKMREDIQLELISVDTVDRRTGRATAATIAFTLSYEGKQSSVVQRVTDTLVSLFLSENLQVRQRQTTETTEFLEEEAQRVRNELDRAGKKDIRIQRGAYQFPAGDDTGQHSFAGQLRIWCGTDRRTDPYAQGAAKDTWKPSWPASRKPRIPKSSA